jgi:hypothetical protein
MQTTLRLDGQLLNAAKRAALARKQSLNVFIVDAVREKMALAPRPAPRRAVRLATFRGKGLQPGVNLDDNSALLDRMDGLA